jgi:DNA-binding NarL/FixJ family response regulator
MLVIADDEVRAARVEAMLRHDRRLRIVTAAPGALADLVDRDDPTILILAMSEPRVTAALQTLSDLPRSPAVILLAAAPHEAWTAQARRAGVRAVLRADATAPELEVAVAAARAGLVLLHPDVFRSSPPALSTSRGEPEMALTPREVEILEMMAEGMSNRSIAARLKISRYTVKFHVASVLAKLGAATRTEAVTLGVRHGLIVL